jgi:pimeloyl-ACP methyl ester carboxylesterase
VTGTRLAEGPTTDRLKVTDYSIFYEIVNGQLVRRMEPIELVFDRVGAGEPRIVLVHSIEGASGIFTGVRDALCKRVEVVTIDLRGFGRSPRPTHDYTVDLWAEDAVKLLDHLGGSPPVVYGHGLGASVALSLAAQRQLAGVAISGVTVTRGEPGALTPLHEAGDRGEDLTGMLAPLTGMPLEADLTPQIVARAIRAWQAGSEGVTPVHGTPLIAFGGDRDVLTPPDAEGGARAVVQEAGGRYVPLEASHELTSLERAGVVEHLARWIDKEVS